MSCFLLMAGGTGGHIFPALAVAQALRNNGHQVRWLGSENAMETRIVPEYDIPLFTLAIKGVRGNGLMRKLALPWVLLRAIQAALKIIKTEQIDAVIGFGGFVSFPGGVAARILGKPLIIHEQNAIAGLSNQWLAKIAQRVMYAFPHVLPYADGLVGNPVRAEIAHMPAPKIRFAQREGTLQLLVIGGSLGASIFNERLPEIMAAVEKSKRPIIVHQCGKNNAQATQNRYQAQGVEAQCHDFIHDMATAYQTADWIICRAGALTVSELAAAGLGGVLVPFPFAVDDHQTHNAAYLANGKAGFSIAQDDFNIEYMAKVIQQLSREDCQQWAENARQLALPDAAQKVAEAAEGCLKNNKDKTS